MNPESNLDLTAYLSKLVRTSKPEQQNNTFWFPTTKNLGKTEDHTPIQTQNHKELRELKEKEKLTPKDDVASRPKLLNRFYWLDTLLTETEKHAVKYILVEYRNIFARQRMNMGMNTKFEVRPTPKNDKLIYNMSLLLPIHLKEDIIVELAFMHKYGITTILPFSKYASPSLAHRQPNGKVHLIVDLRIINTLIADVYTKNNHQISTLSDVAQHLAGKSLICKLDGSQAYHCLQTPDERSVEKFAFSFRKTT